MPYKVVANPDLVEVEEPFFATLLGFSLKGFLLVADRAVPNQAPPKAASRVITPLIISSPMVTRARTYVLVPTNCSDLAPAARHRTDVLQTRSVILRITI